MESHSLPLGWLDMAAAFMISLHTIMNPGTKRSILRWIHVLFALPLIGYIYGPPQETLQYLPYFRYGYFPVVVLSGLWMWKGDALRRLLSKKSA